MNAEKHEYRGGKCGSGSACNKAHTRHKHPGGQVLKLHVLIESYKSSTTPHIQARTLTHNAAQIVGTNQRHYLGRQVFREARQVRLMRESAEVGMRMEGNEAGM